MHLSGGSGKHDEHFAFFLNQKSRGGAIRIRQHFSTFGSVALPQVVFRHRATEVGESFAKGMFDRWIEDQFLIEDFGNGFPGQVITGWSQTPSGDYEIRAFPGFGKKSFDLIRLIPNHEVGGGFDSMMGKLNAKVGQVGVFANAQKQFVSEGDGFNANGQTHVGLRLRQWLRIVVCVLAKAKVRKNLGIANGK